MRRHDGVISGTHQMTRAGLDRIASFESNQSGRSHLADIELRAEQMGLGKQIEADNPRDPFLDSRSASGNRSVRLSLNQSDIQRATSVSALSGLISAVTASRIDSSLIYDLNTIARLRNVFPTGSVSIPIRTSEQNVRSIPSGGGFRQISLRGTSNSENIVLDESVVRGRSYSYYATLIGDGGRSLGQTETVRITVDRSIVAVPTPSAVATVSNGRVNIVVSSTADCEYIEVYRNTGSGWKFLNSQRVSRGETVFSDTAVIPGNSYLYRVYSVDSFGVKSQTPALCRADVSFGISAIEIKAPTVSADVDHLSKFCIVDAIVEDADVRALFFLRKDLTTRETFYSSIGDVQTISLGFLDQKRSPSTSVIDPTSKQNGFVPVVGAGRYRFTDYSSQLDHSYQYCVYAVDVRGARSSFSQTNAVFVTNRPGVSSPLNLSASIDDTNVLLTWIEPNLTVSVADMLGDREELAATSVRNIYQVQRMDTTRGSWENFPLVDTPQLIDSDSTLTSGRPSPPTVGGDYLYRVATFQTGGYYSNYTDPLHVSIPKTIPAVRSLTVTSTDVRVRPFCVTVGWQSDGFDGHWEIERAVSDIEGRTILSANDVKSLKFSVVANVSREASRANPRDADIRDRGHQRVYMDNDVSINKVYVYRVTPVLDGKRGESAMTGIHLSALRRAK
jgi:hypothetical protein